MFNVFACLGFGTTVEQCVPCRISSYSVVNAFCLLRSLPVGFSLAVRLSSQCKYFSAFVVNRVGLLRCLTVYLRVFSLLSFVEELLSTSALCVA